MKNLLKKILGVIAGKSSTQSLFESLYKVGLFGMNVGGTSDIKTNGELHVLQILKKNLRENPIIFDVGANVGEYIESVLKVFQDVEVHAFEPLKNNIKQLSDKFGNTSNVIIIQKGLGDSKGKTTIHFNPALGSMASVYKRKLAHHNVEITTQEEIEIETISNYCKENNLDQIDFLKLDIEGHELAALRGAKTLLIQNKIKYIQFEFGGTNIDSRTFFQDFWYLLSPNYKIYRILKNGLREIKSYNENNEIFGYINYFAALK
ncbi:MAG: FkbM family methyltransferase [Bacteroidota bacterium]